MGSGLVLRLAAATACVVLVPGGIFVRALGRPHTFGVAIAASFAWSLAAVAGALAVTFALDGTIDDDALAVGRVLGRLPRAGSPPGAGALGAERANHDRRRCRRGGAVRGRGLVDVEHDLRRRALPSRPRAEARVVRPHVAQRRGRVQERRPSSRLCVPGLACGGRARRAARGRRPRPRHAAHAGDPDAAGGRARLRGRRRALPLVRRRGRGRGCPGRADRLLPRRERARSTSSRCRRRWPGR